MNLFESQLIRLKECLKVVEDQEVARALGMTKAAFSYRKRVGSFPEEKLISLKAKHPNLDLQYVLFGERWEPEAGAKLDAFVAAASSLGLRASDVARAVSAGAEHARAERIEALGHPLVASLVETIFWCDDEAIDLLVRVAARLRGPKRIPFRERLEARQSGTNSAAAKTRLAGTRPPDSGTRR